MQGARKSAIGREKKLLGLDDGRSWIVIAEGNEFVWPV
jgi:hypothetical protein